MRPWVWLGPVALVARRRAMPISAYCHREVDMPAAPAYCRRDHRPAVAALESGSVRFRSALPKAMLAYIGRRWVWQAADPNLWLLGAV